MGRRRAAVDRGDDSGGDSDRLHRPATRYVETVYVWDSVDGAPFTVGMSAAVLREHLSLQARWITDIAGMRWSGIIINIPLLWLVSYLVLWYVKPLPFWWPMLMGIFPAVLIGWPLGYWLGPRLPWQERAIWTARRYIDENEQVTVTPITYQQYTRTLREIEAGNYGLHRASNYYALYNDPDIKAQFQPDLSRRERLKRLAIVGSPFLAVGAMMLAALLFGGGSSTPPPMAGG